MHLAALALLLSLIAVGAIVVLFMRLTAGARGLRARLARVFRRPPATRPLPRDHYYRPYWTRDDAPRA